MVIYGVQRDCHYFFQDFFQKSFKTLEMRAVAQRGPSGANLGFFLFKVQSDVQGTLAGFAAPNNAGGVSVC